MNICVIANPVAGGGKARRRARSLQRRLHRLGHAVDLCVTKAAGDAERLARDRAAHGFDCFVSVGGDGTANEMLNGLSGREVLFTVLGVGTANVVARQFGIPRDPAALAKVIHHAKSQRMDLGERDGRVFLLGAGAGLDAAITAEVKKRRGPTSSVWIWVWPVIKTVLGYRYPKIRVIADGEVLSETAEYAIVGNCVYSAGVFPSTPKADTADGLLDVCLLHDLTPWKCIALAVAVWWPSFVERSDVVYRQAREISVEPAGAEAAPLQVDGDPAGQLPARFRVVPGGAHIIVP